MKTEKNAWKEKLKTELRILIGSSKFRWRFWQVFLLEIALLLIISIGYYFFSAKLGQLSSTIVSATDALKGSMDSLNIVILKGAQENVKEFYKNLIIYFSIFVVFVLASATAIKSVIYTRINKVKLSLQLYWRFLVTSIVWIILLAALSLGMRYLLNRVFLETFEKSFISQISAMILIAIYLLTVFYFTIALFTPLVLSGKLKDMMKSFWNTGILKFEHALLPLLFSFIVLVLINLILFLAVLLSKSIFVLVTTILLLVYVVWLRFYFTAVWTGLSGMKATKKKEYPKKQHVRKIVHRIIRNKKTTQNKKAHKKKK